MLKSVPRPDRAHADRERSSPRRPQRRRWCSSSVGLVAALLVAPLPSAAAESAPLRVPGGFDIDVFASGLGPVRFMTVDPRGTLLVSVPATGQVVALPASRRGGTGERVVPVLSGLDLPHGVAFRGGDLYVAETGRVRRFRYDAATMTARDAHIVIDDLPHGGHHWTRGIAFGLDGMLYVSIGSSCDACREADGRRATILSARADGSAPRVFATGLRNAVGLAVHPSTGTLWATVNERDWRSGGAPPDYVTDVRDRAFYGWPQCFAEGGRRQRDPQSEPRVDCRAMRLPALELDAHAAPLGLAFYTGRQFPAPYRGDLFVACHGSRAGLAAGYKVVRVRFARGKAVGVEDFATGWRSGDAVHGRPVDVVVGSDGALYVSDDHAGRVYRIRYRGATMRATPHQTAGGKP
jgi:glucose/arabinose dehydrogenase